MGTFSDIEMSKDVTCRSLIYNHKKTVFVSLFLYGCFGVSALIIPQSVSFGPSLCFAYVFSMIQMIEVAVFMQRESLVSSVLMCMTLFTACVLPTMQIYQVMTGEYSTELGDIYSYIYMGKEVILHVTIRYTGFKTVYMSATHSVGIFLLWLCIETLFFVLTVDEIISGYENVVCIARLTPQFYMAALTLVIAN